MAETPGGLLSRSGILSSGDLAAVRRLQSREGGTFGECVLRLGAMEEDQLADFYHRRLLVPRATQRQLDRVRPEALALVPPDMAVEFRVLPVELGADGVLTVAMADPSHNHAVDEVAFFAGRSIVRLVAGEDQLRQAIERHYSLRIPTPSPSAKLAHPVAPAPALAPASASTVAAPVEREPNPSPPPARRESAPERKATRDELEQQIVLLTQVKHADYTPLPPPMPPPSDHPEPPEPEDDGIEIITADPGSDENPILLTHPVGRGRHDTLQGFAFTFPDPPLVALRTAPNREEVGGLLLGYVAQLLPRAALFVVRKAELVGHDARGLDLGVVRQLSVPLDSPSLFREAVAARWPYRGPLPATPIHRQLLDQLPPLDGDSVLLPVAVRDRVIALVYADGALEPLPDASLHAAVREAGLAYERLIVASKAR